MLVLFVTLIAAVFGSSSACDSCATDYTNCLINNCSSDFEDMECHIDHCSDTMLTMAQCQEDNNCDTGATECIPCTVEVYELVICGVEAGCADDDSVCYINACPSESSAYTTCESVNGCETGDDDDDDEECPACGTEELSFTLCVLSECEFSESGEVGIDCYLDDCAITFEDYTVCTYENGCGDEEEVCSPECVQEYVDQIMCLYNAAPAGTFDDDYDEDPTSAEMYAYLDGCVKKVEKMNQCMYDNCLDDYDVGVMQAICEGSDCSNCYTMPDPTPYAFGDCDVEIDEYTFETESMVATCESGQFCSEEWESGACSGTSDGKECYDNNFCMDLEDGYSYQYTWYGGCGAGDYEGGSSASAALFVVAAFVTQMFMW